MVSVFYPLANLSNQGSGSLTFVDAYTASFVNANTRWDAALLPTSTARLEFVYDGVSSPTVPLGDGSTRVQIGMAIRCLNECNGLYVMWVLADDAGGAVVPRVFCQQKSNPGQVTFGECNGNGYTDLSSDRVYPAPGPVTVGSKHTLEVTIVQGYLTAKADSVVVLTRAVTAVPVEAVGSNLRVRADNMKATFSLYVDTYAPDVPFRRQRRIRGLR